jgi:hypothetical protein
MLALKRYLHETLPIGPEEGQTFYTGIRWRKDFARLPTDWQAQVRYILVLQWPTHSGADFDALISMEEQLSAALGRCASVDGHDFGSGEMNIFVATERPAETFADAANALRGGQKWGDLRAAYREALGGSYEILWPEGLRKFSVK